MIIFVIFIPEMSPPSQCLVPYNLFHRQNLHLNLLPHVKIEDVKMVEKRTDTQ